MDIKLKSKSINTMVVVMALYMFSISLLVVFDFKKHKNVFKHEPYRYSDVFRDQMNEYIENIEKVFIKNIKIEDDEIENLKSEHQELMISQENSIEEEYNKKITAIEELQDKEAILKLYEEKYDKLIENKNIYTKDEENLKKEILENRDKEREQAKIYIEDQKDIKYYIRNTKTKNTYTNIDNVTNSADLRKYMNTDSLYSIKIPYTNSDYNYSINTGEIDYNYSINAGESLKDNGIEGYFILPKKVNGYSQIHEDFKYVESLKDRLIKELVLLAISLTIGISTIWIMRKEKSLQAIEMPEWLKKAINIYNKIPLDMKMAILFIYTIIMYTYLSKVNFFYFPLSLNHFIILTLISISIIYFIFNVKYILDLYKNKDRLNEQWSTSLWKITINNLKNTRDILKPLNIKKIILKGFVSIFICLLLVVLVFFLLVFLSDNRIDLFLLTFIITVVYTLFLLNYIFRKIVYINSLITGIEEISNGNLDYEIDEKGSGTLYKIGYNINHMRAGFKQSLESQIKSERLKTELITNVSHDLKTPLTSIINYVNLLKKEDLCKEEIEGYVGVLDRKSQRLKTLIDDLFEVAKLSSGEVELKTERVDVVALLRQAMAEFEEKIKKSSLSIKTNTSSSNIYLHLDGNKTWRVLENLISNALKYSQPNTRVYIDIIENDKKVIITMKNISSHELNFGIDEIFERFKRGDDSRNTEGSGLGLAIAKNIVELQGGKLDIIIDGDLFKVIVEFYKK